MPVLIRARYQNNAITDKMREYFLDPETDIMKVH